MKKTALLIRMSEIDKDKLRTAAEKQQMSMSEYILYLVRRNVDEQMGGVEHDS